MNRVDKFIDAELKEILEEREKKLPSKIITVSAGTTSSGVGDERNLREFLLADTIVKYLREKGRNVFFIFLMTPLIP